MNTTVLTGGSLTSSGTIAVQAGAGGDRYLNSPMTNSGTITIAGNTIVSAAVGHTNSGTVSITAGALSI